MSNPNPPPRHGLCLVLAAPSGAGKTSLSRALLKADPDLELSISVTTRPPRAGEVHGTHYHFITQPAFDAMVAARGLLEYAHVFGKSYGTPRAPVEAALAAGRDVLFDIDWQGFRQLRAALPGAVTGIFIRPPSLPALRARLAARGDTPDQIERRMAQAEAELSHAAEFDHQIENADFNTALAALQTLIKTARATRNI
ncbi:MAG: guanylate kinase [Acidocella sp.]|nr:guanylate kinase [Acidocella sp.]